MKDKFIQFDVVKFGNDQVIKFQKFMFVTTPLCMRNIWILRLELMRRISYGYAYSWLEKNYVI